MGLRKFNLAQLIEVAGVLFRTQGYANTSMADIAKVLGVNKASLYYYFPSKKDLTLAVIQTEHQLIKKQLFSIVYSTDLLATEQAINFEQAVEAFFLNREGSCLMLKLAAEVGNQIPEFAELLRKYFDEWVEVVVGSKGWVAEEEARVKAQNFIALLYGRFIVGSIVAIRNKKL